MKTKIRGLESVALIAAIFVWCVGHPLIAVGSVLTPYFVARWRHRRVFRQSLATDDHLLSFRDPSGMFGNPAPYRWHRYRSWYKVTVENHHGTEKEFCVVMEGTFFGLFLVQVLGVEEWETDCSVSDSANH